MSSIKVKLQLGDKIKVLARKPYSSAQELTEAVRNTYPKRLANKDIKLKYKDEEDEWIYISDDNDVLTFNQSVQNNTGKKVKVVIDVVGKNQADVIEEDKQIVEEFDSMQIDDQENDKKVKFEDLKDFKIADTFEELEKLLNSEDKFGPRKLFKAVMKSAEGTKAEVHLRRIFRKMRKHRRGPSHGFRSSSERGWGKKRRFHGIREDSSSIEAPFYGPAFFGPMKFGPKHGPMSHRGKHFGMGPGPFGHGPRGCGPHGPMGKKKAMKFFKKFMKAYKDSSSSSSSEEVNDFPKPVITNLPKDVQNNE